MSGKNTQLSIVALHAVNCMRSRFVHITLLHTILWPRFLMATEATLHAHPFHIHRAWFFKRLDAKPPPPPLPATNPPPPPFFQTKERNFLPKNWAYLSTSSRSLQHIYQCLLDRHNIPIIYQLLLLDHCSVSTIFFFSIAAAYLSTSSWSPQLIYQLLLDHRSISINFFLITAAYLSTSSWSPQHIYQLLLDHRSISINFFLITAAYLSTSWLLQRIYQLLLDCHSTAINFLTAAAYLSTSSW